MTPPKPSVEDAMQVALAHHQTRTPFPPEIEAVCHHFLFVMSLINLRLDQEARPEGNPNAPPPPLLRHSRPDTVTEELVAIIDFTKSYWQESFDWRDCEAHMNMISHLDLSNPRQALDKMVLEYDNGFRRPAQGTNATALHSHVVGGGYNQLGRTATSTAPTERGSLCALPTPASSPNLGSAQEHLYHSRTHIVNGHMPQLIPQAAPVSRNGHETGASPRTGFSAPDAENNYVGIQPSEAIDMYRRFLGGQTASPGGQIQHSKGQVAPSGSGRPTQQQNQLQTTQTSSDRNNASSHPRTPQSGNTARPNVGAATAPSQHGQCPPGLYLPSNFSSPYERQLNPQARMRAEQLAAEHAERLRAQGMYVPNLAGTKRSISGSPKKTSSSQVPLPTANDPGSSTAIPKPSPAPVRKTPDQIEYERKLADYKAYMLEKEKQDRLKAERKARLKQELDAEMKVPGNDVLAYRYRDYMEVYPCAVGARLSTYHLRLLANQAIEDKDRSEEAMAVRYAKEKWWNFWTMGDRQMVVELLREKKKTSEDKLKASMKASGHLITDADIQAIRRSVVQDRSLNGQAGTVDEWFARRL